MTLVEFLQTRNIPFRQTGEHHHVSSAGFVGVDCPFCSPNSGRFRLGVRENLRSANCWTCGYHSARECLAELTGLTWQEIKAELGELGSEPDYEPIKRGRLKLPDGVGPLLPPHRLYLKQRGFDADELVRVWGIEGIGIAAKLSWRLFIPVHDRDGATVSWTTRTIWAGGEPRYKGAAANEEEVDRKSLLYGMGYVRHACVCCEGPSDVWRIGPGAVATMGVVVTRSQIALLAKVPVRAVCFDREPEAQRRATELCRQLEPFPGLTLNLKLERAKDPGEAAEDEVKEIRRVLE